MAKTRGVSFEKMTQAILETSATLFDQNGFNQTSLQDIAQNLGLSRPSLYYYFENREQILVAGVEALIERRLELAKELQSLVGDPVERLTALMTGLGRLMSQNPVWVRIALREEAALPDEVRARDLESRLAYFDLLVETLREGIDEGVVRGHDERAMALTIVSAISGLRARYAAMGDEATEDLAALTVEIILGGVLDPRRRTGTPLERGIALVTEGAALIDRASRQQVSGAVNSRRRVLRATPEA